MSEKTTSQAQQAAKKMAAAFGIDNVWGFDAWRKLTDENVARATQWWEEIAKVERSGMEQAGRAIDESAKLMHEALTYTAQMNAELRKATFDAMKRTFDVVGGQH